MSKTSPVFALVAGEASGDILGASLISGLKQKFPQAVFVGIGGKEMQAAGLKSWYPMEQLSVMGFFEVLKNLRQLLKLRKELTHRLLDLKPDAFIGIDAPDFNFALEKKLKEAAIKTFHYVGPSVWAWRKDRLKKIKQSIDGMLVLFPFETPIYDEYKIPVKFVGHPMAAQSPENPDASFAKKKLGLDLEKSYTALLPGSRMSEIEKMTPTYLAAAKKLNLIYPEMEFLIPAVHSAARELIEQYLDLDNPRFRVHLIDGKADLVLEASSQAIVTSGTATLQTALMLRPMVIAIKVHPISYWIMKRMALSPWIGLPNILAQESLAPELIQDDATSDKIALEMGRIITDKKRQEVQLTAYKKQKHELNQDSASLAAEAVIAWAGLE